MILPVQFVLPPLQSVVRTMVGVTTSPQLFVAEGIIADVGSVASSMQEMFLLVSKPSEAMTGAFFTILYV